MTTMTNRTTSTTSTTATSNHHRHPGASRAAGAAAASSQRPLTENRNRGHDGRRRHHGPGSAGRPLAAPSGTTASADNNNEDDEEEDSQSGCLWCSSSSGGGIQSCCRLSAHLLVDALRLTALVIVCLPGFVRWAWFYWVTANRTVVRYGTESCRQCLDLYQPRTNVRQQQQQQQQQDTSSSVDAFPAAAESSSPITEPLLSSANDEEVQQQQQHEQREGATRERCRPVIVYYTGGAWMIGYKMWGALLARILTAAGCIVICPDYRNTMPIQLSCCSKRTATTIPDQVDDVRLSLEWCYQHVHEYGGDRDNIILVGNSAGGHLVMTVLLHAAIAAARRCCATTTTTAPVPVPPTQDQDTRSRSSITSFQATDFRGFISLSTPYKFSDMQDTFYRHGMDESFVQNRLFGESRNNSNNDQQQPSVDSMTMNEYDPSILLQTAVLHADPPLSLAGFLPPIRIGHGTLDETVPFSSAVEFSRLLQSAIRPSYTSTSTNTATTTATTASASHYSTAEPASSMPPRTFRTQTTSAVTFQTYPDWTHTTAILEGPLAGQHNFHYDLYQTVLEWTAPKKHPTTRPTATTVSLADAVAAANGDAPTAATPTTPPPPLLQWPDEQDAILKPLCPTCLVRMGAFCNPF